jgi:hypothetical protein
MFANHAFVLRVGVAADDALDVPQPGLKILSDGQVGWSRKDPTIRVTQGLPQDSPAFGLCLRTNLTPLAIGTEESAAIADDFALLVSPWRDGQP